MLKKIVGIMMVALFLVSTSLMPVNASEVPQMEEKSGDIKRSDLEQGWVASIYAFSRGENVTNFPPAAMGSFKADKSKYMVTDYEKSIGFAIKNKTVGWQGQAYIVVEKKGYYVFMLNLLGRGGNYGAIFVNNQQVAQGQEGTVTGNIELEPGVHNVEFRYANAVWGKGKADGRLNRGGRDMGFEFRIKSPTDNAPVPAEKVLYRKK